MTLGELYASYEVHQAHAKIRGYARAVWSKFFGETTECEHCDYNHHVEICHINAIASFSVGAYLSEINDINNLAALCPNCHWDFDHGLLAVFYLED